MTFKKQINMMDKVKIIAEIERLMKWKPKAIPLGMRQQDVINIRKSVLLTLKDFINSLPAEQPREDLEKEIESYLITNRQYAGGDEEDLWGDDCIRNAIKHGAQWQKEQMLKSAIDGTVGEDNPGYPQMGEHLPVIAYSDMMLLPKHFKFGDKIKIIVIKEDEQ